VIPDRAVIVWRVVKHSISSWRGGGKNTCDLPVSWSFKVEDIVGCTHLLVEVEYAQL